MSKKVSTSQVLFVGLTLFALIACVAEVTRYYLKTKREDKAIQKLEEINKPKDELCDHGPYCKLKHHCDHMWCEKHKMYHHKDRVCMHDLEAEQKLEDQYIKMREKELGFKKVTKPVKYKPDIEMNKRK